MKQFLLNQTMDDADEGRLGGLVFHWYCIVNSRPKSHSDSQPAPPLCLFPPSFYFWHHAPFFLSLSFSLFPFGLTLLCIVSRNYSREEPRATLAALGFHWTSFPLHLFANHLSRVRVLRYIGLLTGLLCRNYVPRNLYLFIYTSLPRLARSNRFFLFSSRWYCFFFLFLRYVKIRRGA